MKYIVRQNQGDPRYFDCERTLVNYYWSYFFYGPSWLGDIRIYDHYTHQLMDIAFFKEIYYKMRRERADLWRSKRARYKFRCGPVPYTSGKGIRKGRGSAPVQGITQQMKYDDFTRAKKRVHIREWEEWGYREKERNWKSQRKTQWKER